MGGGSGVKRTIAQESGNDGFFSALKKAMSPSKGKTAVSGLPSEKKMTMVKGKFGMTDKQLLRDVSLRRLKAKERKRKEKYIREKAD